MSFRLTVDYVIDDSSTDQATSSNSMILEVSRLHNIAEVCSSIYRTLQAQLRYTEDMYALYWPERKMWLVNKPVGRVLSGVMSARLEYRLKRRAFKIRFLDASSKRLFIDETLPVKEIVNRICTQLKLEHPEEMSLVVAVDYTVTKHHPAASQPDASNKLQALSVKKDTVPGDLSLGLSPKARRKQLTRPGSAGGGGRPGSSERPESAGKFRRKSTSQLVNKKKQISRKHQMRIDTPWLDPCKTLTEQEVSDDDDLLLMYRFYYNMDLQKESIHIEMLYKQARATFLAGEMLCALEHVPKFTALLCQITRGDFVSREETQDFLQKLKRLLVPPKYKTKTLVKDVINNYVNLKGLSVRDAKCWFIKLWSSMHLFGTEFFSCTKVDTKENGLVGISKQKITFFYHNSKKKSQLWDYSSLEHWIADPDQDIVTLFFSRDSPIDKLQLQLIDYSGVLLDCLEGHRQLTSSISVHQQEYQFDETTEAEFKKYLNDSKTAIVVKTHKRAGSLTYNDICWADQMTNPLVSPEEEQSLKTDSWENPVFENMDQLVEERFSFLDFNDTEETSTGLEEKSPREKKKHPDSPLLTHVQQHSPSLGVHHPSHPSPLLMTNHTHSSYTVPSIEVKREDSSTSSDDEAENNDENTFNKSITLEGNTTTISPSIKHDVSTL